MLIFCLLAGCDNCVWGCLFFVCWLALITVFENVYTCIRGCLCLFLKMFISVFDDVHARDFFVIENKKVML